MTISTRAPGSQHPPNPFPFLEPPQKPDELGRLGHHRVLKLLGGGGMGMVFLAEDPRLQRYVALKVMRPELALNTVARQRFLREARAIAAIRNEHIIAIHDIDEVKEVPYFAADLLQGMPLDVYLEQEPSMSAAAVIELGLQIARGLEAAHKSGLVHRDIKPANIWLEPKDNEFKPRSASGDTTAVTSPRSALGISNFGFRVKILDFGLSRPAEESASLTQCGMIVGTPTYMAPEQADSMPADIRSDLFSLGCVLYEAASGKRTFDGNSVISVLKATAVQDPKPLHEIAPAVPVLVSRLVMRLLAKDPNRRPQSATELIQALQNVAGKLGYTKRAPINRQTTIASPRWFQTTNFQLLAVAFGIVLVGFLWLAPDWVPRPFALSAHDKPTSKAGHAPTGGVRGITDDEIIVGVSAPFSGPARDLGREMEIGIQTCFRQVNADGGIAHRKLSLVALDDRYDPDRALANMNKLYEDHGVFAVLGNVGTPTAEKTVPYALHKKMVYFGAFTGAAALRKDPPDRYVFNYCASFQEEAAAAVKYLLRVKNISADQIAVFAEEGSYGDSAFAAVSKTLRQQERRPEQVIRVGHKRNSSDVHAAAAEILRHEEVHAVIMASTYRPAAAFIRQLKDANRDLVFINLSCVGSDSLAEELRQLGSNYPTGIIVMQGVPQPDSESSTVLQYREQVHTYYPNEEPSYVSLEGYVDAMLFVEGLRRTAPNLTTENLVTALETIRDLDIGLGTPLRFGPSEHQASHKVWGTILDNAGHFQPLELE
jgi:serine/threonine protein kinase/ABC-type branched-subunit amino acid transport system substrate-binding protein